MQGLSLPIQTPAQRDSGTLGIWLELETMQDPEAQAFENLIKGLQLLSLSFKSIMKPIIFMHRK